jgi:hypothetical protein
MNSQPVSSSCSSEELIGFVTYSGESDNIDAKGPVAWDNGVDAASLAKDIAAFANSRDGGVLVIGKVETRPGEFDLKGLTVAQADSFDQTKVTTWVNNHFEPPIRFVCHRVKYDDKLFVVITVGEFEDIPHLCVKAFQDPAHPKKAIIQASTIYVRTANAESAPLRSVEELRTLIGIATKKRGDELVATFSAMLKGRPLIESPTDDEQFETQLQQVSAAIVPSSEEDTGCWELWFRPSSYIADRWPERSELESLVSTHSLHILDEYPPHQRGTHSREWGIANDFYGESWALTRTGLFVFRRPFLEDRTEFQSPWRTNIGEHRPAIPAGQWVEYQSSMRIMIQFFWFMSRLVAAYEAGETVTYGLQAGPLEGRALVSRSLHIFLRDRDHQICRENTFQFSRSLPVEELRSGWENECAASMKEFFELFPGYGIPLEAMQNWVERFKNREF